MAAGWCAESLREWKRGFAHFKTEGEWQGKIRCGGTPDLQYLTLCLNWMEKGEGSDQSRSRVVRAYLKEHLITWCLYVNIGNTIGYIV